MATYQNQAMQVKEVFLRKLNSFFIFFLFLIFLISKNLLALKIDDDSKQSVLNYIQGLNNFSSEFLQINGEAFSNGYFYLNKKRIKIEYIEPTKILIIISKNKAMYYNKDLKEVEYFRPKNTMVDVFYDVFFDKSFFNDVLIDTKKDLVNIKKKIKTNEIEYDIEMFFENNPYIIRKIIIKSEDEKIIFSITNPNYNNNFEKNFFSMVNPEINKP